MFSKEIKSRIQNTITVIILAALVSVIPFYYNTNAMTSENSRTNQKQDEAINEHETQIQEIKVNQSVEKAEIEQIKESLKRIETKLDRLIEKQQGTIN